MKSDSAAKTIFPTLSRLTGPMSGITWCSISASRPATLTFMVEGKGLRIWDAKGKEHLDAVFRRRLGRLMSATGGRQ